MDENPDFPAEPLGELVQAAATMHEMYISLVGGGFTDKQALYLIGQAISAMFTGGAQG